MERIRVYIFENCTMFLQHEEIVSSLLLCKFIIIGKRSMAAGNRSESTRHKVKFMSKHIATGRASVDKDNVCVYSFNTQIRYCW